MRDQNGMLVSLRNPGTRCSASLLVLILLCFIGNLDASVIPKVISSALYDRATGKLTIQGKNFQRGAKVVLTNKTGRIKTGAAVVESSKKILVNKVVGADLRERVSVNIMNPDGHSSGFVRLPVRVFADENLLTASDVETVIAQAVAQADASGLKVTVISILLHKFPI